MPDSTTIFETANYIVVLDNMEGSVGVTPTGVLYNYRVVNRHTNVTEEFSLTLAEACKSAYKLSVDLADVQHKGQGIPSWNLSNDNSSH